MIQPATAYTERGWPKHKEDVKLAARDLYAIRGELSTWEGCLIKGERLVIPYSMRQDVLQRLHEGPAVSPSALREQ